MKLIKTDCFFGIDEEEITGLSTTEQRHLQAVADLLNKIEGDLSGVYYSVVPENYELTKGKK